MTDNPTDGKPIAPLLHEAETDGDSAAIDDLLCQFLEQQRRGEHPDIEHYAQSYPDFADQIRGLFPVACAIESWKTHETALNGGATTLGGVDFKQLGDFQIIRRVGRGGMGVVYEAFQASLSRRVAIKILPPLHASAGNAESRFRHEAQTLAKLYHPHIVPVFGFGIEDSVHYIVMQYIEGISLDGWLQKERPGLSAETIVQAVTRWGVQAATALAYAHQAGILHRDIKPANLMIDSEKHLWVTDFGLAKTLETHASSVSADVFGTLMYVAPERFVGQCDERADIYALGLTLYQLWAGRPPFASTDHAHLVATIRQGIRRLDITPRSRVERDLVLVLSKSIAVDPQDRYENASLFAADLQAILEDRPIAARPMSHWQNSVRWCRRNPLLASFGMLSALLLIVSSTLAFVAWQREKRFGAVTAASLQTTLDTLDRVYQRFSLNHFDGFAPGDLRTDGGAPVRLAATPAISDETAQLLGDLLEIYDRLANQTTDDRRLDKEAIKAQVRVAEIQMRLGNAPQAIVAYQNALDRIALVKEADPRWEPVICKIFLELADAHQVLGEQQPADDFRRLTLHRLESLKESEQLQRGNLLLLARAHFGLGKEAKSLRAIDFLSERGPRQPNRPPPPREQEILFRTWMHEKHLNVREHYDSMMHLEAAIKVLESLGQNSAQVEVSQLLALCRLERAKFNPQVSAKTNDEKLAIELLENLCEVGGDEIRFHLSNAYTQRAETLMRDRANLIAAIDFQEKAAKLLRLLSFAQPNVPQYQFAAAIADQQLAQYLGEFYQEYPALAGPEELSRSGHLLEESVRRMSMLAERFPLRDQYRIWLAKLQISQVQAMPMDDHLAEIFRTLDHVDELLASLSRQTNVMDVVDFLQAEADLLRLRAFEDRPPPNTPPSRAPPSPPRRRE